MTLRTAALAFSFACLSSAMDWEKAPKLPHKLVSGWPQLPAGWNFGETSGVSVDKNDNVWVFNRGKHQVIRFDRSGKFLGGWEDVPVLSAHGIKADPDGNVWLVDVAGHALLKFTPGGRLLMVFANAGRTAGDNTTQYAFNRPTGLSFQPNGDFYVSDGYVNTRVVRYSKDGKYLGQWGKKGTGDGEFDLVHDVALDKQGKVYVADRANSRVQVFTGEGKFLAKWTDVGQPWGLAYSEKENAMYIADGLNNRVVKTNLDGQVLGVLGQFGKAPGSFDFAHHMAIDSEGSIYVAEIKNWRVQKFAK
jgi:DNA-binding beta-propeller fold protein YncE